MLELLMIIADGIKVADRVILCESSDDRRKGLLGRSSITQDEGVLMVLPPSRRGAKGFWTSIHMMFMKFPIAVVWIDDNHKVAASVLAKPWRFYGTSRKSSYILEVHPSHLHAFRPGVVVEWKPLDGNKEVGDVE
jgi:uncharacterized membrane protein (UPF0127 family)